MRPAILIPARMQARRLPGKPLADLGGLPLVVRVARQAQRCRLAPRVAIASDAPEILAAARQHGIEAIATAAEHASGTDRVAEAADKLDADPVINLQGDEPFIEPDDLDALLAALAQDPADLLTLGQPLAAAEHLACPDTVKVICRDDGMALYFARQAAPHGGAPTGAPAACPSVLGHIGVYGCRRAALRRWQGAPAHPLEVFYGLEQLRALAMGMQIRVLPARSRCRGIDTPADLAWARQHLKASHATAQS